MKKEVVHGTDKLGAMYKFSELHPRKEKTRGFLFSVAKQFYILTFG